jgi:hypothetical protein
MDLGPAELRSCGHTPRRGLPNDAKQEVRLRRREQGGCGFGDPGDIVRILAKDLPCMKQATFLACKSAARVLVSVHLGLFWLTQQLLLARSSISYIIRGRNDLRLAGQMEPPSGCYVLSSSDLCAYHLYFSRRINASSEDMPCE